MELNVMPIKNELQRFAVMGHLVSHSLSPVIHQHFAAQFGHHIDYKKISIEEDTFEQQVKDFFNQGGQGLNITLPAKRWAYQLCQQTTQRARFAKAVNTLWMRDECLHGDNTDGFGLVSDLKKHQAIHGQSILILGAGGAVSGVIEPLLEENPRELTIANRTVEKAYDLQRQFPQAKASSIKDLEKGYNIIVHATSASLNNDELILPEAIWSTHPFAYDLSYQLKGNTPFVGLARKKGCEAMDGLGMLIEQAAESYFIWKGVRPDTKPIQKLLKEGFDNRL